VITAVTIERNAIDRADGSDTEDLLLLRRELLVSEDPLFVELRELLELFDVRGHVGRG
jgi:hypothetical protein